MGWKWKRPQGHQSNLLWGVDLRAELPGKSNLSCRFGTYYLRLFGFGGERFPAHDPHGLQLNILLFSVQEFWWIVARSTRSSLGQKACAPQFEARAIIWGALAIRMDNISKQRCRPGWGRFNCKFFFGKSTPKSAPPNAGGGPLCWGKIEDALTYQKHDHFPLWPTFTHF